MYKQNLCSKILQYSNIGEKQFVWSTAAQAALGVAFAGADIIKVGLAELRLEEAIEIMTRVVRNVKYWPNFRNSFGLGGEEAGGQICRPYFYRHYPKRNPSRTQERRIVLPRPNDSL